MTHDDGGGAPRGGEWQDGEAELSLPPGSGSTRRTRSWWGTTSARARPDAPCRRTSLPRSTCTGTTRGSCRSGRSPGRGSGTSSRRGTASNGSHPSRAIGGGYWKATGADRPVACTGRTVGVKKSLVFYHGRPGAEVKTDWIMHEYRLAGAEGRAGRKRDGASLRLDDWVLCRLYNRKNQWEKMQRQRQEAPVKAPASQSASGGKTRTPEFDVDNDAFPELDSLPTTLQGMGTTNAAMLPKEEVQELELDTDEWLMGISLDNLQGPGSVMLPWDDSYAASFLSPVAAMKMEQNISPFLF